MEMTPKAVVTQVAVAQVQVAMMPKVLMVQVRVAVMPKAVGPSRMLETSRPMRAVHPW